LQQPISVQQAVASSIKVIALPEIEHSILNARITQSDGLCKIKHKSSGIRAGASATPGNWRAKSLGRLEKLEGLILFYK